MRFDHVRRWLSLVTSLVIVLLMSLSAYAAEVSVQDGEVTISDTAGTAASKDGVVEITVTAVGGSSWSGKTESSTITITNTTENIAQLSFNYSITGHSSFTLSPASGTYSETLGPGASVELSMSVKASRNQTKTATLTLSEISLVVLQDTTLTLSYDSSLGSVTANGQVVSSVDVAAGGSVEMTATTNSGSTFLGWIDAADNRVLSTETVVTYKPLQSGTIKAVFINADSPVYYGVGNTVLTESDDAYQSMDKDVEGYGLILTGLKSDVDDPYNYCELKPLYLFDNLSAALNKAENSTSKGVVVMNSGTLPAGDYTIPSGVTLLVPFDSANTMYTTAPGFEYTGNWSLGKNYRTLTLAEGTNIYVNGAISLSTVAHSADGGEVIGYPCGDYSEIAMQAGSTITINNGGALYAWGFITGSGSVTAKTGATVYENFQLADYRGGSQSSSMGNKVFAGSQYYVQNIEVPLKLEAGATENCCTWVNLISYVYHDTLTTVPFVASNGLFNITSGSITKSYDGTKDRWTVEIDGDVSIASVALNIGNSGTVNSARFVLGINNNLTLKINSGTVTVGQDVALLPGSELIIAEGATCKLGSGVSTYIYDAGVWGNYCYTSSGDKTFVPVPAAQSRNYYTRTDADLVDAVLQVDGTLDASEGHIYTTVGDVNIHSTGSGIVEMNTNSATVTYQFTQGSGQYTEIDITSAKLKNADGTYVDTTEGTYTYSNGVWSNSDCDHNYVEEITTPAGCETAGEKTFTCSGCGDTYTEPVEALDHIDENTDHICDRNCGKTDMGTHAAAEGKHTCDYCGQTVTQCADNDNDHNCDVCGSKLTDCSDGEDNDHSCDTCGKENISEHSYSSEVTAPTFEADGYTTYTCACGDSYVVIDEGSKLTAVAQIGEKKYESLAEAVENALNGETVKLLSSVTGAGIVIDKDITIDFGGFTYTVNKAVGSAGTETLGFQILNDNTVTIQNGELTATTVTEGKAVKVLIQNYADLTLNNVTLDGTGSSEMQYVLSNNSGEIAVTGATHITAPEGAVAFDVYDYSSAGYAVPSMTVNTTGTITGKIEVSEDASLAISGGTYTVDLAKEWCAENFIPVDNGDGTYGVKIGLPKVEITDITASLTDVDPDLTFALNFVIANSENLTEEYLEELFKVYGEYYVDYVLTISGLTQDSVTFNANGDADGYLAGQYDAFGENWVAVPFENVEVKNDESLYIMEYAAKLMGQSGLRYTLMEVAAIVQNFDCGVYFTPEFLAANPDMEVSLELKVFTEDADGNIAEDISVAVNNFDAPVVVASVGNVGYATLKDAVAAAQNGEDKTAVLLTDIALTTPVDASGVTLDLNGNTLVLAEEDATLTAAEGLTITTSVADRIVWYTDGKYIVHAHTEETIPGKDASCTETGLTDGKKCSVCGEVLVKQEEIPATGEHTPGEPVKETEDGVTYEVVYCTACKAEISRETINTEPQGPVPAPNVKIFDIGLILKDYIGLQVAVDKTTMNDGKYDKAYYGYVQLNPDGTEAARGSIDFNMETGKYVGAEFPVLAWSMSDEFVITIYYEVDGITYQGETSTASVKAEAMERIGSTKTDDTTIKTRTVCVAMLNYGAAVQDHFNHSDAEVSYLANSELSAEQKALPKFAELNLEGSIVMPDGDLRPASAALNAKERICVQFPVKNKDMSGYEVRYTIDSVEQAPIPASAFENMISGKDTYCGPSIALTPRQMRSEIVVAFYDTETGEKVYGDIICRVEALAKQREGKNTEALTIAMIVYGDAAEARFGK